MKALHPDFIQEVKDRIDIVDVISEQVNLKRTGKEHQGLCPFHDERTPSFSVSPTKKLAHCFACSWGGDAIKFVMELNKVSFTEVVLDFARRSNVPIRYADGSTDDNFPAALPKVERKQPVEKQVSSKPQPEYDVTKSEGQVSESVFKLLNYTGDAEKAREWLAARGITSELIKRYRIGFGRRQVKPDQSNPDRKKYYGAITIFPPVPDQAGRYYELKRVSPWLIGNERPNYLGKWSQPGVPATIWFTYKPEDAQETEFCEGPWDAIALAELARTRGEKVAVVCSTSGCGTVPSKEQLDQLPGKVRIFYDHDDAGRKGAEKLAKALGERGQICSVPIPDDYQVKGWDVSNALDYGYTWEDFVKAKILIIQAESRSRNKPKNSTTPPQSSQLQSSFSEYTQMLWENWRNSHLFKPNAPIINSERFHTELPKSGTLLGIRSGLGTGKTYWLLNTLIKSLPNKGFLSVGYRNSLLLQFCSQAKNWYHLQQDLKGTQDAILIRDTNSKIACCIDSLIHFKPEDFDGRVVILDEIESIINQLLQGNTLGYARERIKELFVELLNRADRIICLDGHLTDITINYLQSLQVNPKKLITVYNQYKGNRGEVEFYLGAEGADGQIKVNDDSPVFQAIKNNQKCFAIGSDAQTKIESLDKILSEQGRKTLRLDSTTSTEKWVPDFLKNPNEYIRRHQIEVLLYSPSAEAGLNIDIKNYFSDIYFLFCGVITTKQQLQMLGRIRDPEAKIHVYCKQIGLPSEAISKSPFPEQLQKIMMTFVMDCALASLTGVDEQDIALNAGLDLAKSSADKHFYHQIKLIALENHERANLRACLREALEHSGYKVQDVTGKKSDISELKNCGNEIKNRRASAIYSAQDISIEEANSKASQFGATQEDKAEITRSRLKARLPDIEKATYIVKVPITPPQPTIETPNSEPPHLADNPDEGESKVENTQVDEPTTTETESESVQPAPVEYEEVEKPVFTPEFIRQVLLDNPGLISQIETYWLLLHLDKAKELQQSKWFKKLNIFTDPEKPNWSKKMNLSNYKSPFLKVSRLKEMGIMHFLQPDVSWDKYSPEVINFFLKGENPRNALALKVKVGNSTPCEYLGRVLGSLGVKTKLTYDKKKKTRIYRVDSEWLNDPVRNAIYEAVGRKFEQSLAKDKEVVDWSVIEKRVTQSQQSAEVGSPSADFVYKNQEGDPVTPLSERGVEPPSSAAVISTDTQFCLEALASLEAPDHPSISTQEELVALFDELEAREQKCGERLPNDFWKRAAVAFGSISESFEKAQTQSQQSVEVGSPSADFVYKNQEGDPLQLDMENGLEKAVRLLKEAINHGAETIQAVWGRWTLQERQSTLLQLQRESEEVFNQLISVVPQLQAVTARS